MKKTPYRVVTEFTSQCDILRAACTCPAGLGSQGKGKCNHVGGVLFALEDFTRRGLQKHPEPLSCKSRLSVWVVPRNQSVAAKPLDQVLIRKIRFGKKNIRLKPKVITFDPRPPQQRKIDDGRFKILSENLQNCLASSSFFLFHDIKSNCSEVSTSQETAEQQESVAFTDSYDIATNRLKSLIDEHVSSLTITQEEIQETERLTKGQSRNKLWFEKRKTVLTASNFGNVAKTKVEPSNKLKAILYSNLITEAVQYGIESEQKAVDLFTREMSKHGTTVAVEEPGLSLSKDKPYLGASLDTIVAITDTDEKWGMEIKFSFTKRNHDYFCQVQGQLYCSIMPLKGIFFVVYFGENMPLFIEKIHFESTRWHDDLLPKVDYFYRRAFLPEMLTKRVQRGKVLYLHGGWLPYGQYLCSRDGLMLHFQREK